MKQLDSVIKKDPLKLKSKEGAYGPVTSRTMYIFLIGIPVCLLFSLLFYGLGSAMTGSNTY